MVKQTRLSWFCYLGMIFMKLRWRRTLMEQSQNKNRLLASLSDIWFFTANFCR